MAQVALHLKHPLGVVPRCKAALSEFPAKAIAHAVSRHIGEVTDHSRQCHAPGRQRALCEVVAFMPVRVGEDGVTRNLVKGNILCCETRRCCQRDTVFDPVGKVDRPLQGLHATQAPANDGSPPRNTEIFCQPLLAADPIFHLRLWKTTSPWRACLGVECVGSRGSIATTQVI